MLYACAINFKYYFICRFLAGPGVDCWEGAEEVEETEEQVIEQFGLQQSKTSKEEIAHLALFAI